MLLMYLYKEGLAVKVKGQGPTKAITVHDTQPYGHAPTYQISLTYLERHKCYGLDKKILFLDPKIISQNAITSQITSHKSLYTTTT
jgi:hypothetical protein